MPPPMKKQKQTRMPTRVGALREEVFSGNAGDLFQTLAEKSHLGELVVDKAPIPEPGVPGSLDFAIANQNQQLRQQQDAHRRVLKELIGSTFDPPLTLREVENIPEFANGTVNELRHILEERAINPLRAARMALGKLYHHFTGQELEDGMSAMKAREVVMEAVAKEAKVPAPSEIRFRREDILAQTHSAVIDRLGENRVSNGVDHLLQFLLRQSGQDQKEMVLDRGQVSRLVHHAVVDRLEENRRSSMVDKLLQCLLNVLDATP